MANSITFKDKDGNVGVINAEHVCYCWFLKDGKVSIQFVTGNRADFDMLTEREREALKRALRITPA